MLLGKLYLMLVLLVSRSFLLFVLVFTKKKVHINSLLLQKAEDPNFVVNNWLTIMKVAIACIING